MRRGTLGTDMFGRRRLACSFCGKGAAEVAKLVAGPKAYICDACVAAASRIMQESGPSPRDVQPSCLLGVWRRLRRVGRWRPGDRSGCEAPAVPTD